MAALPHHVHCSSRAKGPTSLEVMCPKLMDFHIVTPCLNLTDTNLGGHASRKTELSSVVIP